MKSSDDDKSVENILLIVPWSLDLVGGVNRVVTNLYGEYLRNNTFRPIILINSWEHPTETYKPESGRDTIYLLLQGLPYRTKTPLKEIVTFVMRWPVTLLRLYRLLRNHRIDIVNPHFPGLYLIHFAVIKILLPNSFRFIVSFHGSDIKIMEESSYYASIMGWILKRADAITVPCNALGDQIKNIFPNINFKIHCIYNGIDQNKWLYGQNNSNILPEILRDNPFVLHVGSFQHVKGQDILIRAFRILHDRYPGMYLLLTGGDGSVLENVKKGILDFGLLESAFILTNVNHDDIPYLMEKASLIVLPSRSEGFPLVLLEAGMSNRAVIASRVGGIPELIRDGETGLLVPPEDHLQLAAAMIRIVENDVLRKHLADGLFNEVSTGFSWKKTAEEYAKISTTMQDVPPPP